MTSAYAVRIYELLTQHRDIGNRNLNLKWLRGALQMEVHEYKLTADFIKRVLDPAVDQINKHSDLAVRYKPAKTGRAITDFALKIKIKDAKLKRQALTDQEMRDNCRPEAKSALMIQKKSFDYSKAAIT